MKNLIKTMPIVATVALLVAGAFLFAGCEKEKKTEKSITQSLNIQGRINKIVGPCHGGCIIIDVDNIEGIGNRKIVLCVVTIRFIIITAFLFHPFIIGMMEI